MRRELKGFSKPNAEVLERTAEKLGISVDELLDYVLTKELNTISKSK
ncbi:MAG: hypothetical protein NT038_07940 [Euryarchaeota archaeon]|nr:hypothetical protein [Euryarchaeota archaeon]